MPCALIFLTYTEVGIRRYQVEKWEVLLFHAYRRVSTFRDFLSKADAGRAGAAALV